LLQSVECGVWRVEFKENCSKDHTRLTEQNNKKPQCIA
jgi:hypothetical protein